MKGTIRARGPSTYQLVVSVGLDPATGKYRQVTKTVKGTKATANRELRALIGEVEQGRHHTRHVTVADLMERWIDQVGDELSPKTVSTWRSFIARRIRPAIGDVPVAKLTTAELDAFYLSLSRDSRLAPATVRQIHRILSRALRQAVKWGWIAANPALNATAPRQVRHEPEPPAPEVVIALVREAQAWDPEFATYIFLAAATGARRGELCGLRWPDLDGDQLRIRRSICVPGAGQPMVVKETKTNRQRTLTLDPGTVAVLDRHRAQMAERARVGRVVYRQDAFVFSSSFDGAEFWNPENESGKWRRLCKRTGVAEVRLHDLRHWTATRLIDAGVPIPTVAKRLGHASPQTTLTVYAHAVRERDDQAAAVMGALLSGL